MVCPGGRGPAGILAPCHCKLCSQLGVGADEPATSGGQTNRLLRRPSRTSGGPGLKDVLGQDRCSKRRKKDIIIRNKKAVKCLSHRVKAAKELSRKKEKSLTKCYKPEKPRSKKPPPRKPSSLADIIRDKDDCACELMASAIRDDLHKHLAMANNRLTINAGSPNFDTPPRPPSPPPPPRKRFYFF